MVELKEGMVKKGGLNQFPKTPRPANPPQGSNPIKPKANWSGRKFRHKPEIVRALQNSSGQWLLVESDIDLNNKVLYEDEEFRQRFEPIVDEEKD